MLRCFWNRTPDISDAKLGAVCGAPEVFARNQLCFSFIIQQFDQCFECKGRKDGLQIVTLTGKDESRGNVY